MFHIAQRRIGLLAALFLFLSWPCLHAQTPIVEEPNFTATLTFDVAVIRLAPPPDANFHVSVSSPPHSSRFDATNLPIKALLQIAYGFDAPIVSAVKQAISYCGLCSAENSSADKVMRMPISKQRNKHIQHVLVEVAKLVPQYSHELALLREKEIQ